MTSFALRSFRSFSKIGSARESCRVSRFCTISVCTKCTFARGDGSKPGLYNSLVQKMDVGIQNTEILKVTARIFKSYVSSGVGSNPQLTRRGSNLCKKVPHRERLQLQLTELNSDNGKIGPRSCPGARGDGALSA